MYIYLFLFFCRKNNKYFFCEVSTGWWFSLGTPVSSTNKTDRLDITEILLKVALNTIIHPNQPTVYVKTHNAQT
jgi:hypothetical protein